MTGWRIEKKGRNRRLHNDSDRKERRGRKPAISKDQIIQMDKILMENGQDGRVLTWLQVGNEVGLDGVSEQTIRNTIGDTMDWRRCIACKTG